VGSTQVGGGGFTVDEDHGGGPYAGTQRSVEGGVDAGLLQLLFVPERDGVGEHRVRRGIAQLGPACQRLEAHGGPVRQGHDGLKDRGETPSGDGGVPAVADILRWLRSGRRRGVGGAEGASVRDIGHGCASLPPPAASTPGRSPLAGTVSPARKLRVSPEQMGNVSPSPATARVWSALAIIPDWQGIAHWRVFRARFCPATVIFPSHPDLHERRPLQWDQSGRGRPEAIRGARSAYLTSRPGSKPRASAAPLVAERRVVIRPASFGLPDESMSPGTCDAAVIAAILITRCSETLTGRVVYRNRWLAMERQGNGGR
jgi:hypothetical protein